MTDNYPLFPSGQDNGATAYQRNGQQSDQQNNPLFNALLAQTMQQGSGAGGPMGAAGQALSKYMMMNAMQNQPKGGSGGFLQGVTDPDGAFGLSMGADD